MAPHSSVLALRIPGAGESGGLPSMGSHRVRHDWSDLAAAGGASDKELACQGRRCGFHLWVCSREDPLEQKMTTHSSILAWRIPWTEEPGRLQSMGLQRVRHNWATKQVFKNFPSICQIMKNLMYSFSIKLTKTKPTIPPKKQKTCHTQIYNYDADQSSTNKCGTTYKREKKSYIYLLISRGCDIP